MATKKAATEDALGELHYEVAKQYQDLVKNKLVDTGKRDDSGKPIKARYLSPKEHVAVLSGAAKFLNDNKIKAHSEAQLDELRDELANAKKNRDFGDSLGYSGIH